MHIVDAYSRTSLEDDHATVSPDPGQIRSFIQWLHDLAAGLQGELVLVALEQRPTHDQPLRRIRRFVVGAATEMTEIALGEASKDWVNLYFGGYVVRPGPSSGARGTRDDITGVIMLGVDQDADTGRAGVLTLEPNLVVQTSHTPTVNRQSFYLFDPKDLLGHRRSACQRAGACVPFLRIALLPAPDADATASLRQLHANYPEWCKGQSVDPLAPESSASNSDPLWTRSECVPVDGDVLIRGARLAPARGHEASSIHAACRRCISAFAGRTK
jgi:hypothetical protein